MKIFRLLTLILLAMNLWSCQKSFLEVRPDKALLVPSTLADFQALLDNNDYMNLGPSFQMVASDEITANEASLLGEAPVVRNSYLWLKDIFEDKSAVDWNKPYEQVFYSNIVLDGLLKFPQTTANQVEYLGIKGSALFFRAFAMYNLSQQFMAPYYSGSANKDMGLPLHRNSDVNERPGRGTVQQTYDFIINDLIEAEKLLPEKVAYKSRPVKAAATALLARIYLIMGDYDQAGLYADRSIKADGKLMDYNNFLAEPSNPINPFPVALPFGNDEILFYTHMISNSFLSSKTTKISADLYNLYDENDLRKAHFFVNRGAGVVNFKGTYAGSKRSSHFAGIANDEIYLIRAECFARNGNVVDALADLNYLLERRWVKGSFLPLKDLTEKEALKKILIERKKELVYRGLRWSDLRRLNLDSEFATTLTRVVGNQNYALPANDPRYVFPIPLNEIAGSGIEQNER